MLAWGGGGVEGRRPKKGLVEEARGELTNQATGECWKD